MVGLRKVFCHCERSVRVCGLFIKSGLAGYGVLMLCVLFNESALCWHMFRKVFLVLGFFFL